MLIFPQKRMHSSLMMGETEGVIGRCSEKGWSNSDLFPIWLNHFMAITGYSQEDPHIIVLDGLNSHKSVAVSQ